MAARAPGPKVASAADSSTPKAMAHHSASETTAYAPSVSPEAWAEAKRLVVATLSQKKRYAVESVSIVAGPSAASSVAEPIPTTAVSTTESSSDESHVASTGSTNLRSSSVDASSVGQESAVRATSTLPVRSRSSDAERVMCAVRGGCWSSGAAARVL